MAEKPEDLGLPHAVVNRIINDALPAHTNVTAEARRVIGKTASVFVLYVTATSASLAGKHGRKTMNSNDVLEAVEEMDFHQFIEPLQKSLEYFRETQKSKKNNATKKIPSDEPPPKKNSSKTTTPTSKSKKSSSATSTPSPPRKSNSNSKKSSTTSTPASTSSKKSSVTPSSSKKTSTVAAGPSSSVSKKSSGGNVASEVISISDSE